MQKLFDFLMTFLWIFGSILDSFWMYFGMKNRDNFLIDFWTCYFCMEGAWRCCNATLAGALTAQMPPRRRPQIKKGYYNDPMTTAGSQDRGLLVSKGRKHRFTEDLTRPGPLARRIVNDSYFFVVFVCSIFCESKVAWPN